MVTRKDVAKHAGVSTATISNVINNRDVVSTKIRERVLNSVKVLRYKPNMVARSLKTKETLQVALIINDIRNEYYAEVVIGVEEEATLAGYSVCILNAKNYDYYMSEVIKRQFDGIIIIADKIPISSINEIAENDTPIVFVGNQGYSGVDERVTEIFIDMYSGAYELFEYLFNLGHRKVAYISARALDSINEPDYRIKAFVTAMNDNGISVDYTSIFIHGDTLQYAFDSAYSLLMNENRPTAIFTGNDNLAMAVMEAVRRSGLRIPEDVSVAGFDNLDLSKYLNPSLTTVENPKYRLGKKAMKLLLKKMKGEKVENFFMQTELIIRKSTQSIKTKF